MPAHLKFFFFPIFSLKKELQRSCVVFWEENEGHYFEFLGYCNRTNDIVCFIVRIAHDTSFVKQRRHIEVDDSRTCNAIKNRE